MKRVLVTGAHGFVGRHSLAPLVERGYEVYAVASKPRDDDDDVSADEVRWRACDLLHESDVETLVREVAPTHLLHFAWYVEPGKFWSSRENLRWAEASLRLFRAFAERGGRRIVAAGTCAEYDWADGLCSESETPLRPATLYGACKHATSVVLEALAREAGLSAAWGRIFFLYGPAEPASKFVASVTRSLLKGEEARCTHGRQRRDLLHVADVAGAFAALLDSDVEGAVNIASGHAVELREVVGKIAEKTGREDLVRLGAVPAPDGEPPLIAAEVKRLSEEVGFRPAFDLDAGLDDTIRWWRQHLT